MIAYAGRHAEFYDLFYLNKPYASEALFVHQRLARNAVPPGSRVLELACGTGNHALHLAELGYGMTATDYSADMLAVARAKAAERRLPVDFYELDMRAVPLPDQPYDAVVCLFDSIGYVQTDQALNEVFSGVRKSLRTGGIFLFEFWHAPAMVNQFDPLRVRRFSVPAATILRIAETTLMREHSLARVDYNIYELRADLTYDHITESQTNRFFTVSEMMRWADQHKFEPVSFHCGFQADTPVTDDSWHVVAVWRKP